MSKALATRGAKGGPVPALCSAIVPGLGQLVNGEGDKAVGIFVTYVVAGAGAIGAIPLIGWVGGVVAVGTWGYSVLDALVKRKR